MEQQQNMNGMPGAANNMTSMHRPQSGNQNQQLYAVLMERLRKKIGQVPPGWQSTFDIRERASQAFQIVSALRLLGKANVNECIAIAEQFEDKALKESPSKETYFERVQNKLGDIQQKRQVMAQAAAQSGQMGMMNNAGMGMGQNNFDPMQNGGMGAMNMNINMNMGMGMNMPNGGMGMPNQQMGINGGQNFPTHLQRQMQPSPLPFQQQQIPQGNTMDPSALQQNPQMPQQMTTMNQPNMQPQQQQGNPNQDSQAQQNQASNQEINNIARQMLARMNEENKTKMRNQFVSNLNDQQKMQIQQRGGDPLLFFLAQKVRQQKNNQASQGLQQNGGMQMGGNVQGGANNVQQTPTSQAGGQNFDIQSFMGQQANAFKTQESGGEVVPASNNNNGGGNMSGQMNMQQGVNPQMLGNQNGQAGNNQQLQMQFMAMQQEKQKRERFQKQQQLAQQQALAAQQQLRGQPGGLNAPNALNGGQANSPGVNMNMLTRPMVPPGQTTPSTPQPQNRPQGMPQTPASGANQLVQHHQNMMNQNNQQQMNQGGQPTQDQRNQMMARLPQEAQAKLSAMAPDRVQTILDKYAEQLRSGFSAASNQPGVPAMPQNMNNNLGASMMGNQQNMMNGMPPNMGNAVPGFNTQPPTNQQQPQGANNLQVQQRMQQHQQGVFRQRAMDIAPFPRQVLQSLSLSVPDQIIEWGRLKQHIIQNQAVLPPNSLERLNATQNQWFEAHPEDLAKAVQALQQRMQQNQQQGGQQQQQQGPPNPNARPQSGMAMQNGQAPQAQMVPPAAPMQQQPPNQNLGGANVNQQQPRFAPPTPQDVQTFRQKFSAAAGLTDDQIRQKIVQGRMQQVRNQQMQRAQQQGMANAGQQGGMPQGNQQQQPQQRPPQPPNQQQANNQAQGQKRPQSEDIMEIPNPNQNQNGRHTGAAQAPPMQAAKSQQPNQQQPQPQAQQGVPPAMPMQLTKEQLESLPPDQRALYMQKVKQMEALRKAQMGLSATQDAMVGQQQGQSQGQPRQPQPQPQSNQAQTQGRPGAQNGGLTEEETRSLRGWMQEAIRNNPKGQAVQLDAAGLQQAQMSLRKLYNPINQIDKTFHIAFKIPSLGEKHVKEAMRARIIVSLNAADDSGNIKDYLAVTPAELQRLEAFVTFYYAEMKKMRDLQAGKGQNAAPQNQAKPNGTQAQQARPQQQTQPQKAQQQAPPVERKPSQQGHAKKASTSSKVPAAPTENKTFDWGAPSPHGVPKYEQGRSELTADKLKIPPPKKRKTGESASSTPAGQAGTPGAVSSPVTAAAKPKPQEQAKKPAASTQQKAQEPQKPMFRCNDEICDYSIGGFETEELLKQHKETAHAPIEDPLKFLLEHAATTLGVDQDGKELPKAKVAKPTTQARARPTPAVRPVGKKEAVGTPMIKQESNTPATPASTGKGMKPASTPGGKQAKDGKMVDLAVVAQQKEQTLLETMAAKVGIELLQDQPDTIASDFSVKAEEDATFMDMLQNTFASADGFHEDWSDFVNVSDWGLRPESDSSPDLTPSDQISEASRESDISQSERLRINLEWDPFSNGDTVVPEILKMRTLGLGDSWSPSIGEDTIMTNGGETVDRAGVDDQYNWSTDLVDWDAMFAPNAGLDD